MEQFFRATGMRKVFIAVYVIAVNALLLKWGVLPADDYKVVVLAIVAGFFGANMFENRGKPEPQPKDDKKKI